MSYTEAKARYAALGVDTEAAMEKLLSVPVSLHCWQGDDVIGFDNGGGLTGGIQTTGNYPGRARTPAELAADIDEVVRLVPGRMKLNLHACYAVFGGERADRDALKAEHFAFWIEFAKERGMGVDFNPTFFSHPMVKDNLTLSSPDETVRAFWVEHGKRCVEIAERFAEETGEPCLVNFWIPDGYKDVPADRVGPRERFRKSLDEILSVPYDKNKVFISLESKVFGIGLESYTVGSAEFCLSYAAEKRVVPLLDNGHYHPTELVSDKISSLLLFHPRIALHLTRGVRWDSDHVVLFDDETREIARELVRCGGLDRAFIATDYFDASINRVAAWVTGVRSVRKALLFALLEPSAELKKLQDAADFTSLMAKREELGVMPFGDVWEELLRRANVPCDYLTEVRRYEKEVLVRRI